MRAAHIDDQHFIARRRGFLASITQDCRHLNRLTRYGPEKGGLEARVLLFGAGDEE
jgi:hypothetical protein